MVGVGAVEDTKLRDRLGGQRGEQLGGGAGITFIQILDKTPVFIDSWGTHCEEKRITARGCPNTGDMTYEKQYAEPRKDCPGNAWRG